MKRTTLHYGTLASAVAMAALMPRGPATYRITSVRNGAITGMEKMEDAPAPSPPRAPSVAAAPRQSDEDAKRNIEAAAKKRLRRAAKRRND